MAKNISLTITHNGVPEPGAKVVIGEYSKTFQVTNEQGKIVLSGSDDLVIICPVYIELSGGKKQLSLAYLFEAEKNYTIDVPEIQQG